MVYFSESGLEIKLVAADNKEYAFPEQCSFRTSGITFFEAEPNAEFFIAVRRRDNGNYGGPVTITIDVDGQQLGWKVSNLSSPDTWATYGLFRETTSREYFQQALKFITPLGGGSSVSGSSSKQNSQNSSTMEGKMGGEIVIKVRECLGGQYVGAGYFNDSNRGVQRQLKTPEMRHMVPEEIVKKKFVGVTSGSTHSGPPAACSGYIYDDGEIVETIRVKYATFERLLRTGMVDPRAGAGDDVSRAASDVAHGGGSSVRGGSVNNKKKKPTSKCIDLTLSDDDDDDDDDKNEDAVASITPPPNGGNNNNRVSRTESSSSASRNKSARRTLFQGDDDEGDNNQSLRKKAKKKHNTNSSSSSSGRGEPDVFILCDSDDDDDDDNN